MLSTSALALSGSVSTVFIAIEASSRTNACWRAIRPMSGTASSVVHVLVTGLNTSVSRERT